MKVLCTTKVLLEDQNYVEVLKRWRHTETIKRPRFPSSGELLIHHYIALTHTSYLMQHFFSKTQYRTALPASMQWQQSLLRLLAVPKIETSDANVFFNQICTIFDKLWKQIGFQYVNFVYLLFAEIQNFWVCTAYNRYVIEGRFRFQAIFFVYHLWLVSRSHMQLLHLLNIERWANLLKFITKIKKDLSK